MDEVHLCQKHFSVWANAATQRSINFMAPANVAWSCLVTLIPLVSHSFSWLHYLPPTPSLLGVLSANLFVPLYQFIIFVPEWLRKKPEWMNPLVLAVAFILTSKRSIAVTVRAATRHAAGSTATGKQDYCSITSHLPVSSSQAELRQRSQEPRHPAWHLTSTLWPCSSNLLYSPAQLCYSWVLSSNFLSNSHLGARTEGKESSSF